MDCIAASSSFTSGSVTLMRKAKDVALFVHDLKVFRETALDRWMSDVSTGVSEVFPFWDGNGSHERADPRGASDP